MTEEEATETVRVYERQRNTRLLQAAMAFVGLAILIGGAVLWQVHRERVADQRWCSLMVSLDDRYQALPRDNISPDALKFAEQIHTLRQELHCPRTRVTTPPGPLPSSAPSSLPTTSRPSPSSATSSTPPIG